jgi:predicted dehydrogenase
MSHASNRRTFLKSLGAISASAVLTGHARAASPSTQVTLGCIGVGSHGTGWNLDAFLKIPEARVLAVCDVFKDRREDARQMVNKAYGNEDCEAYEDFRDILARDDIDAVVISTPDHWHVLMSVMAARAGKHVFCEKPTLNVTQGEALIRVIQETGVVYQGGIEDRSVEQYHRLAQIVRNGHIGKLHRILVKLPEGEVFPYEDPAPVPDGLNYDLWLGPAPQTPYTPSKLGRQEWRNVWDYSGGKLTDWGAHLMDTAQVAMFEEHGGPLEVEGKGAFPKNALSTTATTYSITYRYPENVTMVVESGGTGIRFIGSEGWVDCPAWRKPLRASDPDLLEVSTPPETDRMWPRPPSEHADFINAILKGGTPTYTPRDIHHLSNAMHVGNISMRLGRKLKWDPMACTFPDDEEARGYLSCPMRKPWTLDTNV